LRLVMTIRRPGRPRMKASRMSDSVGVGLDGMMAMTMM